MLDGILGEGSKGMLHMQLCYLDESSLGNTQEVDCDWQFLHKLWGNVS